MFFPEDIKTLRSLPRSYWPSDSTTATPFLTSFQSPSLLFYSTQSCKPQRCHTRTTFSFETVLPVPVVEDLIVLWFPSTPLLWRHYESHCFLSILNLDILLEDCLTSTQQITTNHLGFLTSSNLPSLLGNQDNGCTLDLVITRKSSHTELTFPPYNQTLPISAALSQGSPSQFFFLQYFSSS